MNEITTFTTFDKLASHLENNRYLLIPKEAIPLTCNEWEKLIFLTQEQNLPYTKALQGDTQEALSMSVFRVKLPGDNRIFHADLMNLLGSPKMLDFYRKLTKNFKVFIDRCQVHLYRKNDFISRHIDSDSHAGYLYSVLFAISEQFTGGEMVLYKENRIDKFRIPYQSILLTDSSIPHEVLAIKSGSRHTVALFLMEKE